MAATQQHSAPYDLLAEQVNRWDERRRKQQIIGWLARVVVMALGAGIVMGIISRMQPWMTGLQLALISAALAGIATGILILVVWLWPRSLLNAARYFDHRFELQERMSTAMELLQGRIHTVDEMATHQIADAQAHAGAVDLARHLPYKVRRAEWVIVALLIAFLAVLVVLPNNQIGAKSQNAAMRQAIAQAASDVRSAVEDIAADAELTEQQRQELLESLQSSLETLNDEEISAEEAMATTSDVQTLLEDQAADMRELTEEQRQAMREAAEAMRRSEEDFQEIPSLSDQLSALSEEMSSSDFDPAELADAAEQAAQAMESASPEMAQTLREMADALNQGDMQAAQQALQQGSEQAEQMEGQTGRSELSADQLAQMAQQMQQDREGIAESSESGAQQEEGSGSDQGGESQQGEGQPQPGQQEGSGDESGGQQSSGEPGDQSQPGSPQEASGPPGQTGEQSAGGSRPADPNTDTTGAQGDEPEGGQFGEGQEREYEPVFAPRRLGGEEGESTITLESDQGNLQAQERDQAENPEGETSVPYNQVYSDYANAANQALDTSYIPLGLRDVVREYFTSLAPSGSSNGQ